MRTRILTSQDINGRSVVNYEGINVGHIDSLVVDLQSEQILFAVLYFGGIWWQSKDCYYAIPLNALRFDSSSDNRIILDMDKKELKNAPGWSLNEKAPESSNEFIHAVFDYYGYNPRPSAIFE